MTELIAGKYRVHRLLGRGGMGSVWEGVHDTLGTRVAVKFIEAQHAENREARARFDNEARAAAKLHSKHVVRVYDHGVTDDGRPYIVMEYLEGEPLDARLERQGRLSPQETASVIAQVCRALINAHGESVVHRDLKPENVFLVWDAEDQTDVVKVVDFGIAKFTDNTLGISSGTRTGSLLGTPYYMSPEQARGLRSVDYRTDLWSLGVIAYECMVGERPFEGEAMGDLLVKICTEPIPLPSQKGSDLPPGFDAWMLKALAREPSERFQSAQELSAELAETCGLPVPRAALPSTAGVTRAEPLPASAGSPPSPTENHAAQTAGPTTLTPLGLRTTRPKPAVILGAAGAVLVALALAALTIIGGDTATNSRELSADSAPAASTEHSEQESEPSSPSPKPLIEPSTERAIAPSEEAAEPGGAAAPPQASASIKPRRIPKQAKPRPSPGAQHQRKLPPVAPVQPAQPAPKPGSGAPKPPADDIDVGY